MTAGQASTSDSRKRRAEAADAHWAKRVAEGAVKVAENLAEIEARKAIAVEQACEPGLFVREIGCPRIGCGPTCVEQAFGGATGRDEATDALTGNVGSERHVLDGLGCE